jgi:hypothetical protein
MVQLLLVDEVQRRHCFKQLAIKVFLREEEILDIDAQ